MNKVIFLTLFFCGLAFSAQSQSLTYSRVLLVETLDTVPQGKVWKVVSYYSDKAANYTIYCKINNLTNTKYQDILGSSLPKRWPSIGITYLN